MATYTYRALSSERAVRMLQLEELNSENISTVRCSLIEVDLDELGLTYQAFCYTGDDDPVPLNYYFTFPTLLWVDAICINQNDHKERMQQVALMREIFGRASQVVAWLGRASEHTVPAFRLLFGLADLYDTDADIAGQYVSHVVRHESFQGHWVALGELLDREWWRRVWVIQEITLARKAVLLCGPYAADWERVRKATAGFNSCMLYMGEILEATVPYGQPRRFSPFRRGAAGMRVFRQLRFEKWERPYLSTAKPPSKGAFLCLLDIATDYQSKDKRDKVYAILGLSEELNGRQPLCADYTKSVCEVYMETARLIFEDMGCLEFLNQVEKNRDLSGVDPVLPSWVPDWAVPSNQQSCLRGGLHRPKLAPLDTGKARDGMEKFSFTCGSTARCDFCFNTKTITVEGFVVGTIGEVHQRYIDVDPDIRFEGHKRFCKRITWGYPRASEVFERHSYWLGWLGFQSSFPPPRITVGIDERRRSVRQWAINTTRCFKVTRGKSCLLACSDGLVQPGDFVCALFGGNMPYILRPKGDSWLFIGQWQVIVPINLIVLPKDMMNGKIMEYFRAGHLTKQEFVIK
ncbi:heterokaryon incompatibility protein-domain-containing protein [Nemania abortiva]|nr:heterokaryon incompatibility protein-domain-containing protein [Nemania abortiva]